MPKYDFLLIGAALVDILAVSNKLERIDLHKQQEEHLVCLNFASKTNFDLMKSTPGGSALNVAITLDCLGAKSAFLTAVGRDVFGGYVLDHLRNTNIAPKYVKKVDEQTGIAVNVVFGGEKSAMVYHGAADKLGTKDITDEMVRSVKRIIVTSIGSKSNYKMFLKTIKLAKKHNVPLIFAPSMTMISARSELKKLKNKFEIMMCNYEEAVVLTGKTDIKAMLKALPGKVVVITKDADGVYAREKNKFIHVNALKVKVKNTTGAGDVFTGGFIYTYYDTGSLEEAIKMGVVVAAMKLGRTEAEIQCFPPKVMRFLKVWERKLKVKHI